MNICIQFYDTKIQSLLLFLLLITKINHQVPCELTSELINFICWHPCVGVLVLKEFFALCFKLQTIQTLP